MKESITLDEYKGKTFSEKDAYIKSLLGDLKDSKFIGQMIINDDPKGIIHFDISYQIIFKDNTIEKVREFNEIKLFSDASASIVLFNLNRNKDRNRDEYNSSTEYYIMTLDLVKNPGDNHIFSIKEIQTIKGEQKNGDTIRQLLKKLRAKLLFIDNEIEAVLETKERKISNELDIIYKKEKNLENEKINFANYLQMKELGFWDDIGYWPKEEEKSLKKAYSTLEENIEYIQKYLAFGEKRLVYDLNTLRSVYLGLLTGQLLILNGRPGTGKSSLAEGIAEAFGAEFYNVAVQANWMDKSDLLGYYDSLNKKYVATEFLEKLIDFCDLATKKKNEQKLYIICLDEMNLAYVEYYFADFLVQLQRKERCIELYSTKIYQNMVEDFKGSNNILSNLDLLTTKNHEELKGVETVLSEKEKQVWNRLLRYRPVLKIPPNIRFIGTINKDETTRDLSPKVIDRSFFVRIESPGMKGLINSEKGFEDKDRSQFNNSILFGNESWSLRELDYKEGTIEKLIGDFESSVNFRFSPRMLSVLKKISFEEKCLGKDFNFNDIVFSAFVLPRINIDYSDSESAKDLEKINNFIKNQKFLYSEKIFDQMNDKRNQEYTYWR